MSSLRSASGSSGLGFAAAFLALALALEGVLTAGVTGAGADEAGKSGGAAGGETVGARSRQPGTLLRSTQPMTLITGPLNVLSTALTWTGTRSTKQTTGCNPSAACGS